MSQSSELTLASSKPCDVKHLGPNATEARRGRLMPPQNAEALAETFRILGDPTRVRIIEVLSAGELCVCDLASLVDISESAVSHQLRLLRDMRLVRARRTGAGLLHARRSAHPQPFQQGLRHVTEDRR